MVRHAYSWEEEVLIIDLYSRTANADIRNSNPEIIGLCDYLRSNGYDCGVSGIRNKMENLKSVDKDYTADGRVGRNHISIPFRDMWINYQDRGFTGLDRDVQKAYELISEHGPSPGTVPIGRPSRDGQTDFRRRILAAYDCECCISGMREPLLLQACHIKPYRTCMDGDRPDQAMDTRNGLCMNNLYHTAFDRGLIAIDEDKRLIFSPELHMEKDDRFFRPFEGKKIYQSDRAVAGDEYLEYHRKHIFKDSLARI